MSTARRSCLFGTVIAASLADAAVTNPSLLGLSHPESVPQLEARATTATLTPTGSLDLSPPTDSTMSNGHGQQLTPTSVALLAACITFGVVTLIVSALVVVLIVRLRRQRQAQANHDGYPPSEKPQRILRGLGRPTRGLLAPSVTVASRGRNSAVDEDSERLDALPEMLSSRQLGRSGLEQVLAGDGGTTQLRSLDASTYPLPLGAPSDTTYTDGDDATVRAISRSTTKNSGSWRRLALGRLLSARSANSASEVASQGHSRDARTSSIRTSLPAFPPGHAAQFVPTGHRSQRPSLQIDTSCPPTAPLAHPSSTSAATARPVPAPKGPRYSRCDFRASFPEKPVSVSVAES